MTNSIQHSAETSTTETQRYGDERRQSKELAALITRRYGIRGGPMIDAPIFPRASVSP
jgi:hypothetical protein